MVKIICGPSLIILTMSDNNSSHLLSLSSMSILGSLFFFPIFIFQLGIIGAACTFLFITLLINYKAIKFNYYKYRYNILDYFNPII